MCRRTHKAYRITACIASPRVVLIDICGGSMSAPASASYFSSGSVSCVIGSRISHTCVRTSNGISPHPRQILLVTTQQCFFGPIPSVDHGSNAYLFPADPARTVLRPTGKTRAPGSTKKYAFDLEHFAVRK